MIDHSSEAGSSQEALAPTRPSLKLMTERELHDPRAIERLVALHGLETMGAARDAIGAEILRRTTVKTWDSE